MSIDIHKGPFGSLDSSRARSVEDSEVVGSEGFIKMYNITNSDIDDADDYRHHRIIVGKKGTGKTLYLRRSYLKLKDFNLKGDIYSEDLKIILENNNQNRPQTELITRFSQLFNGEYLTEKWRELWRRAVLRTIISHILYSPKLLEVFKRKLNKNFIKKYKSILSEATSPITIFSQVTEIINSIRDNNDFDKFCNNILWTELDLEISQIISSGTPLYFFVDAIDDDYQHAPMYWLRAQKGLFYCIMQFLRDPYYGGKLHIMITIRDHVYSSILQSEHSTRYREDSHIAILRWDEETAKYLLKEKIKYLSNKYFVNESEEKNIENFLGVSNIMNTSRNVEENILSYLIRHTRAIPRDVVLLGNALSIRIEENKKEEKGFLNFSKEIKKIVHQIAKNCGDEQLQICANHLTSNLMPNQAIQLGVFEMFTSKYTGMDEYLNLSNVFLEKISLIIKSIGKDRFSKEELFKAKAQAQTIFDTKGDLYIFDILWQNGLIGYEIDEQRVVFFNIGTEFSLPLNKMRYAFHSILIDALEIKAVGLPVIPI